jgi:hypothetical protein
VIAERHHWLNTVVGILDATWHLTEEEQLAAIHIVGELLDFLNIPERGEPAELPISLVMEIDGGYYTDQLFSHYDSGAARPVRATAAGDVNVAPEVWRTALVNLFTTAYPDLDPVERMGITKIIGDLLAALGVTYRAPSHIPDEVVRVARNP